MSDRDQMSVLMRSRPEGERLLRLSTVARRLGWSVQTIRKWITKRQIVALKMPNGQWMVPESEVNRWLNNKNISSPM